MRNQKYLVVLKQGEDIVVVTSCTATQFDDLVQQNNDTFRWEKIGPFKMIGSRLNPRPHFAINGLLDT